MDKEFLEKYYFIIENYRLLGEEIVYFLKKHLKKSEIPIANIGYRVKTLESLIEKTYRKNYRHPFEENTDFVGVRIVNIYKDDIDKIKTIIKAEFEVLEESNKTDSLNTDQFGYEAIHYLVKLSPSYFGPRYEDIKDLCCEIQLRTILQDAWALVSHHLGYKRENEVQKDIYRKLYALSGAFETADDQLVQIKQRRFEYINEIRRNLELSNLTEKINLDNLTEYLKRKFPILDLETTLGAVNNFPTMLKKYGYVTLQSIDKLLEITEDARVFFNKEETWGKSAARELFIALGLVEEKAEGEFALDDDIILIRKFRHLVSEK